MKTNNNTTGKKATRKELEVLFKLSQVIQSCTEPENTYNLVLELLEELVDFEFAALFIYSDEREKLNLVASKGHAVDLIQPVSFDMGNGLSAWVAKQKRPILLSELHRGKILGKNPLRSFLSIPLLLGDKIIGVMNFGHIRAGSFTKHNLQVLTIAAGQLSVIIERSLYFNRLAEKNRQLERTNHQLQIAQDSLVERERLAYAVIGQKRGIRLLRDETSKEGQIVLRVAILFAHCFRHGVRHRAAERPAPFRL